MKLKTEVAHGVWTTERETMAERKQEDIFVQENSNRYDYEEKIKKPLDRTHLILHIDWSPELSGYPVRRPRSFCAGLNRETVAWAGPPPAEVQEHFASFVARDLTLDATVFLKATPSMVQKEQQRLAAKRGFHIGDDEMVGLSHEDFRRRLLTPCQNVCWQAHNEHRLRQSGHPTTPWVCDLEQFPNIGKSTPGPILPSHLTHGILWVWLTEDDQRVILPFESLAAHGFNVMINVPDNDPIAPYKCTLWPILQSKSASALKSLVGNGFHLPTMAAWQLYILVSLRVDFSRVGKASD